jgi:glycolate oxidase FAD binding subunit
VSGTLSIAGVTPGRMLVPTDRIELASIVRDLYAAGKTFAFVGGGTELDLGNQPRSIDTVVRTTALDRVIDYSPEDQTITVEAGMRIAALDVLLEAHDQLLPIETGDRRNATVGGVIATNAFGSRRHRYGSIKDLIVGIEFVRPDGVVARGGGKVVKNVAGFDLPKLLVGSLGTLGGIVGATFRVFPKPAVTRAVLLRTPPASPFFDACLEDRSLEPIAVAHHPAQGGIVLTFAGPEASVERQLAHLAQVAAAHAVVMDALDGSAIDRCAAAESAVRCSGAWRWTVCTNPAGARSPAAAPVATTAEIGYPTLGVTLASASDDVSIDALAAARGRATVFRAMPPRARARIDAWGDPPPSFPLMRALKLNFDPKGLCNPGRFVGGL